MLRLNKTFYLSFRDPMNVTIHMNLASDGAVANVMKWLEKVDGRTDDICQTTVRSSTLTDLTNAQAHD